MVAGRKYWTIRSSVEGDSDVPVSPWLGRAVQSACGGMMLCHFNMDDTFDNLLAYPCDDEVFETEREALAAYVSEMRALAVKYRQYAMTADGDADDALERIAAFGPVVTIGGIGNA